MHTHRGNKAAVPSGIRPYIMHLRALGAAPRACETFSFSPFPGSPVRYYRKKNHHPVF